MKKQLKENIFLYPRYNSLQVTRLKTILSSDKDNIVIFAGKVDTVPESIAQYLCNWMFWDETPEQKRFYNYGKKIGVSYPFLTAKESIKSACDDAEFCLIVKKPYKDDEID